MVVPTKATTVPAPAKDEKKSRRPSSVSESSIKKAKTDLKRVKKSSEETGESKLPVTPVKKVSADDTAIVADSPSKGESKN